MGAVVNRVRNRACSGTLLQALKELDLSSDDMRDEILLLLLAGHHTTGNAAAWLLYYLATEPGLAARLAEEMQAITSDSGEIDPLKLPKAELSLRVAREILRLYPPFYWFSREVRTPQDLGGIPLKRGTSLIISPWQLQRNDRYWTDPDSFRLDRTYNTPAFMPFGLGPRACVGIGLGLLELQLLALELICVLQAGHPVQRSSRQTNASSHVAAAAHRIAAAAPHRGKNMAVCRLNEKHCADPAAGWYSAIQVLFDPFDDVAALIG